MSGISGLARFCIGKAKHDGINNACKSASAERKTGSMKPSFWQMASEESPENQDGQLRGAHRPFQMQTGV